MPVVLLMCVLRQYVLFRDTRQKRLVLAIYANTKCPSIECVLRGIVAPTEPFLVWTCGYLCFVFRGVFLVDRVLLIVMMMCRMDMAIGTWQRLRA